jgi:hypothetical protein
MRKPGSDCTVITERRCDSFSQNGQAVRRYRQRVPQQPQARNRLWPGSMPTSHAIAGSEPQVGQ